MGVEASHGLTPSQPSQASEKRRSELPKTEKRSPDSSDMDWAKLLCELELLDSSDALTVWAQRALPLKNQLSAEAAQAVEDAFAARLGQLAEIATETLKVESNVGKSRQTVMVIGKPVRERDRHHLKFVSSHPCLICGRSPSDAHHVKFAEQRGMGRKVSDRFTVPVCRLHHRELHRRGHERTWWESHGIDPLTIATTLWHKTHPVSPDEATNCADAETKFKGRLENETVTKDRSRNCETKPIIRHEAG